VTVTEIKVNGRQVVRGTELTIRGWSGRYRFQYAHVGDDGAVSEVVTYGGSGDPRGRRQYRSTTVGRIRTVHRIANERRK
jgi:hypothetical protein